jgi:transcriptional regulator with XRE-family HTH domain
MNLGDKLKQLRLQNDFTQEELADRCELTKGYISQLENDLTSPSIATLVDILSALGTTLQDFFTEEKEVQVVFKEKDYVEKIDELEIKKWLVVNAQKNLLEPLKIFLKPNGSTEEDVPHEGEEFGYVLEGEIVLHLGNKKYVCKKGDTFYYKADKKHYVINTKQKNAVFIWISCPPTF